MESGFVNSTFSRLCCCALNVSATPSAGVCILLTAHISMASLELGSAPCVLYRLGLSCHAALVWHMPFSQQRQWTMAKPHRGSSGDCLQVTYVAFTHISKAKAGFGPSLTSEGWRCTPPPREALRTTKEGCLVLLQRMK